MPPAEDRRMTQPHIVTEPASGGVTYRDRDSVILPDGSDLAMTDAIARLSWQPMLCPTMPHSYVVSTWSSLDRSAFDAILAMIRHSPDTVLAYWRGYQSLNRYWRGPNGFRYWTTPGSAPGSTVLNRTDDLDDTRPASRRCSCPSRFAGRQVLACRLQERRQQPRVVPSGNSHPVRALPEDVVPARWSSEYPR